MPHRLSIRAARVEDVDFMHALLAPFAEKEIVLARDKDNICQHLQEFLVAEYDGKLAGVVAVHIYSTILAEIRSLVVAPKYQHHGLGALMVEACEKWVVELGVTQIFALTYVTVFFEKQGYKVVSKESLPHKIWTVCVHCSRFSHCDEVAVLKKLGKDAQAHTAPIIEISQG